MEELVNIIVNNGLGIASFFALMVFIFKYQTKSNETLDEILKTLITLNERIENLEKRGEEKWSNMILNLQEVILFI